MISSYKRRRLRRALRTRTDEPCLPNSHSEPDSSDRGQENSRYSHSTSGFADGYSNLIGHATRTKQYAREILEHEHSTIDIRPDGSILITPCRRRQLPNEIISMILSHITSLNHLSKHTRMKTLFACTLVSKQFHAITNPALWQSIINIDDVVILERFLHCLCDAPQEQQLLHQAMGRTIRRLDIQGTFWTDAHLMRLLPHLSHLEHLTIISRQITYKSFRYLPQQCQQLKSIHLERTRFTPRSLDPIGAYCRQLTHLTWHLSKIQELHWLSAFSPCKLEQLQVSADSYLNENTIASIQSWCRLTRLVIDLRRDQSYRLPNVIYLPRSPTTLLGHRLISPNHLWPQLKTFRLSRCDDLHDTSLIPFIQSHPHLDGIHLGCASELTDASLATMTAQWLPQLRHLTVNGSTKVSSDALRRFIWDSSPHLTTANFEGSEGVGRHDFAVARKKRDVTGTTINWDQAEIEYLRRTRRKNTNDNRWQQ